MYTIKGVYEEYERYSTGGYRKFNVEEESLKEALLDFIDEVQTYITEDTIDEWFEEYSSDSQILTAFLNEISSTNGDGCAYIVDMEINGDVVEL